MKELHGSVPTFLSLLYYTSLRFGGDQQNGWFGADNARDWMNFGCLPIVVSWWPEYRH